MSKLSSTNFNFNVDPTVAGIRVDDQRRFRVTMTIYTILVYAILVIDKWQVNDARWQIYQDKKLGEFIPQLGPLTNLGLHPETYRVAIIAVAGLLLASVIYFLHKLVPQNPLHACIVITFVFCLACIPAWLSSRLDPWYLIYYAVYGGFLGLVEGIWRNPFRVPFFNDPRLSPASLAEIIKFEEQKWARGWQLLTQLVIAILIGGTISYVLKAVPDEEKNIFDLARYRVLSGFLLAIAAIPGMALIYWNFIQRGNFLHHELLKALVQKDQKAPGLGA